MDAKQNPGDVLKSIRSKFKSESKSESERPAEHSSTTTTREPVRQPSLKKEPKQSAVGYNEDGSIHYIYISSSTIKSFLSHGVDRDICPLKTYHLSIIKDYDMIKSKAIMNGNYFETKVLGMGRGESTHDLPKKGKAKDKKTADHERIDEQVHNFARVIKKHKIIVERNGPNVQVLKKYAYTPSSRSTFNHPNIIIVVAGTFDLVSPLEYQGIYFDKAVLDVKLPKDRNGGFGEFNWGNVKSMDHTQLVMYAMLSGFPSFYFIFDYKTEDRGYRLIPVLTEQYLNSLKVKPANHKFLMQEGKLRTQELNTAIERTAEIIIRYEAEGWDPKPERSLCHNCSVSDKNGGYCTEYDDSELA